MLHAMRSASNVVVSVRNLQKRRSFLTAGLLSSDYIQKRIQKQAASTERDRDISPLVLSAGKHTESNHYRVAFSATSFPYTDPSPHSDSPNLLGVRIDVCGRDGRFTQPYYVLLRREKGGGKRLRVHRHTIPAFISMEKLERKYLPRGPQTDDDDDDDDGADEVLKPWKAKKQDLPALVRQLRQELVSWHLRRDTVEWLNEQLGLSRQNTRQEGGSTSTGQEAETTQAKRIGIVSVSPTSLEARYVRVEWEDGRVGRFKISNNGIVERAVVIGDNGRDKSVEDAMTGGDGRVETIFDRLAQRALSES